MRNGKKLGTFLCPEFLLEVQQEIVDARQGLTDWDAEHGREQAELETTVQAYGIWDDYFGQAKRKRDACMEEKEDLKTEFNAKWRKPKANEAYSRLRPEAAPKGSGGAGGVEGKGEGGAWILRARKSQPSRQVSQGRLQSRKHGWTGGYWQRYSDYRTRYGTNWADRYTER